MQARYVVALLSLSACSRSGFGHNANGLPTDPPAVPATEVGIFAKSYELVFEGVDGGRGGETTLILRLDFEQVEDGIRVAVSGRGKTAPLSLVETNDGFELSGNLTIGWSDASDAEITAFSLRRDSEGGVLHVVSAKGRYLRGGSPASLALEGTVRVDETVPRANLSAQTVNSDWRLPWGAIVLGADEPVTWKPTREGTLVPQYPNESERWVGVSRAIFYPSDWESSSQQTFKAWLYDRATQPTSQTTHASTYALYPVARVQFGGDVMLGAYWGDAIMTGGEAAGRCPTQPTVGVECLIATSGVSSVTGRASGYANMFRAGSRLHMRFRVLKQEVSASPGFEVALVEPGSAPVLSTPPNVTVEALTPEKGFESYGWASSWVDWSIDLPKGERVGFELRMSEQSGTVLLVTELDVQ